MKKNKIFNSLYWKISLIFLGVLLCYFFFSIYIFVGSANKYSEEVNQKIHRDLAPHTVDMIRPHFYDGKIDKKGLEDIFHSMMVINPSVEVYVLNSEGKILSYVAPDKVVKLEYVDLTPIKNFIIDDSSKVIYGEDPRTLGASKIFSAAEIREDQSLVGYIYIILASQKYVSVAHTLENSYILGLSMQSFATILLIVILVGLIAIWLITRKLNVIISGIEQFRNGNFKSRIKEKSLGELGSVAGTFNNMADTIEQNIEELKSIDTLRREMISNISHDLRTPIASIQGYAETLKLKNDTLSKVERENYTSIIVSSCSKLKKLVNDLFELTKLETGNVNFNPEPFSISELVFDICNEYKLVSQKKNVTINTVISKEAPLIMADISLIERALQNLLDNSIKYCKEGDNINVEVLISEKNTVLVNVRDTGPGIKNSELPHVFDRYYKTEKHKNTENSTGLGLAIVKKIMDLHHSNISVRSQNLKGTVFSFQLPVAA